MHCTAEQPQAPAAVTTDLRAIFVSLELGRSTWLITSLSPGGGEKMSKHQVRGGDMAALLARFSELKARALTRTGTSFPLVVIQEAGLDGFWIHRALIGEVSGALKGRGPHAFGLRHTGRLTHRKAGSAC
jgi:transposase